MQRYMIELTHDDDRHACIRALEAVRQFGSHLVTRTDWGCKDDVHSGWIIVECDSKEEAMMMVPPELRHEARVVCLCRFTPEEIEAWAAELDA